MKSTTTTTTTTTTWLELIFFLRVLMPGRGKVVDGSFELNRLSDLRTPPSMFQLLFSKRREILAKKSTGLVLRYFIQQLNEWE